MSNPFLVSKYAASVPCLTGVKKKRDKDEDGGVDKNTIFYQMFTEL
jgi:hypothetical protein